MMNDQLRCECSKSEGSLGSRYGSIGGIILAGGRSRRMNGEMKSLLTFAGMPMVKGIALQMSKLCHTVTVAAADEHQAEHYRNLGLAVIVDEAPDHGPLVAFHTALHRTQAEIIWLSACDMPLADMRVAEWLLQQLIESGASAVIPQIGGRLHPLQAVYRKACTATLAPLVASGERSMRELLQRLDHLIITEETLLAAGISVDFVCNINTPQQYEQLLSEFPM